jgi:ABC-2 type transport system permease protein
LAKERFTHAGAYLRHAWRAHQRGRVAAAPAPRFRDQQRTWFTPNQQNTWFFSIADLHMMTPLFTIVLSTAAMARDNMRGTIEQLLVLPLTPIQIVLPKVPAITFVIVLGQW